MNITKDIHSLSDFKQNASKMVKQIRDTKQPMVLTVNGKAAVVVQDALDYEEMLESQRRAEAEILRNRLKNIDDSDSWPTLEEAFNQVREKYGFKIK